MRTMLKELAFICGYWMSAVLVLCFVFPVWGAAGAYPIRVLLELYGTMAGVTAVLAMIGWIVTERLLASPLIFHMLLGCAVVSVGLWTYAIAWGTSYNYGYANVIFPQTAGYFFAEYGNMNFTLIAVPLLVLLDCIWIYLRKRL